MISPLFSTKSIWLTRFFLDSYVKGPSFLRIFFAQRFLEASCSLGLEIFYLPKLFSWYTMNWLQYWSNYQQWMGIKTIKGQYMNRSTFWTIKYMNGSVFSAPSHTRTPRATSTWRTDHNIFQSTFQYTDTDDMSRNVRKRTFGYVRPAKIQFRLRICAVWSGSSLGAFRIAENAEFLYLDNEDSGGQTAQRADLSRRKTNKSKGTFSLVGAPLFNVIYTCNNISPIGLLPRPTMIYQQGTGVQHFI